MVQVFSLSRFWINTFYDYFFFVYFYTGALLSDRYVNGNN